MDKEGRKVMLCLGVDHKTFLLALFLMESGKDLDCISDQKQYRQEACLKLFEDLGYRPYIPAIEERQKQEAAAALCKKVSPDMVPIKGGTFMMAFRMAMGKKLYRPVTLGSFWAGRHKVTQEEFWNVMGYNPSYFQEKHYNKRMLQSGTLESYFKSEQQTLRHPLIFI